MASLVLLVACWFLLKLTGSHAQINCTTIESIFPPSGTVEVTFTITGNNLGGLQRIDVDIGIDQTATIGERNETHLQFLITGTLLSPGPRDVTFTATPSLCQAQQPIVLDLRQDVILSRLQPPVGQSGSIIELTGRFPPNNGDNSTVTGVLIGGISADVLLAPSVNTFSLVVQAGPSQINISNANFTVISEYSSFSVPTASFKYTRPGNINMVTPSQGQTGTRVVITGENLEISGHRLAQVLLAGNEATVEDSNNTMIVCTLMSGGSPGSGSVILNYTRDVDAITYNGPTVVRNNSWVQLPDGVINRTLPSTAAVNQTIFACGESLLGGGSQITSVLIGSVSATQFSDTSFTLTNLDCINITLPSGVTGSLTITLTADTGAVIGSAVTISIASVNSVNREFGQYGTRVNISGVELFRNLSSTTVMLAGVDASIESSDSIARSWIVVRAGRPPLLSRLIVTEDCTTQLVCTPVTNTSTNCPNTNCSDSRLSDTTFLTEPCLTTCFGQNVSMCFTMCSANGTLNQICFLQCENSTTIDTNSTACFTNCEMPCCDCDNVTICVNDSTTEMFEGSFRGQVAIITEALGRTFNLTNSSVLWTYNISGRIETTTPSFGQMGTRVALNGTNLFGYGMSLQQLLINGTMATLVSNNSTYIVFGAPDISNGSNTPVMGLVDIELTSDSGAIVESVEGFEYRPAGMITSLSPPAGQLGTYVNISGENLLGYGSDVTSVMFGGQPVSVINASNSTIFIRINASRENTNEEPVNVTIVSDTFAIVTSAPNAWRFVVEGRVTRVTPTEGQSGTFVNLAGTGLLGNGVNIISVYLDGVLANVVDSPSNTEVRVRISTNNQRRMGFASGEVRIIANTGAIVTAAPGITFNVREPGVITGFSPRIGREGTYITITGINLHGFGGDIVNATVAGISVMPNSIQFDISNTSIVVVRAGPSSTATSGIIQLSIETGSTVISNTTYNFTYVAPGNITMVTPSSGVEGTGVLITGDSLYITNTSLISVFLAGAMVTRVVVDTPSIIAVTAGPSLNATPSSPEVLITASDGSVARGSAFTYDSPYQLNLTPSYGQFGTRLTISFPMTFNVSDGTFSVLVDNVPATIIDSNSSAAVISIPRGQREESFAADIVVENAYGELATLADGFIYLPEGVIIDVTPDSGQQGTVVNVTGYQLLGGGSVIQMATLAGLRTRIVNSSNSTVILEVMENIDNDIALTGDVVLTADTMAAVRQQRAWTAVVPSEISMIQPINGQFGTIVNISGVDLLQGGLQVQMISLAGIEVYDILNVSSTFIMVRAANGSAGNVGPVMVQLETGARYQSTDNWSYNAPTTISRVFPEIGAVGSTITIQLADFNSESITMITIGNITANILTTSDDSVSVTVPIGNYSSDNVTIVIETASGLTVTQSNAFTIEELGNITDVYPAIVQQGIEVTITGENLLGISNQTAVQTVWLAGIQANRIISYNNSVVIVEAGYSPINVSGNIRIQLNTSASIDGDLESTIVSYYEAEILSVTPSSGYNGTMFTITGDNLVQPNSSLQSVMIGDINATVEEYNSDYIIARAGEPSEADANVNMTVIVMSQSGAFIESPDSWMYNEVPRIERVTPNITAAGQNVTISGRYLPVNNMSTILIGGIIVEVLDFSDTVIEVQLSFSVGNSELQQVQIINDDGTEITSDPLFSYDENIDNSIISVTPSAGLNGTIVIIVVNNTLSSNESFSVYLANIMAINATIVESTSRDNTTIIVTAGFGNNVTGDIFISDESRQIGLQDGWRYLPVLNSSQVTPVMGQQDTAVTITVGPSVLTEFNLSNVTLAGVNTDILSTSNDTVVMVQAGQMMSTTAPSDVVLYFEGGITLPIRQSWSYLPPINVTMVSNNAAGYYGSIITIYGINFLNGQSPGSVNITEVLLTGINVTILSYNDTIIICNISEFRNSSQGAISGPIIVRNSLGFTADTSNRITFTYVQVNVMNVSPGRGQNGTMVTIQGVGLLANATNITTLWLNNVLVRSIISANNSVIVVVADYSNVMTPLGNITYCANTGAMVTAPQAWYYVAPAVVSSVSPASGSEGTVVTIRGTDLLAGASPEVGSINAVYLDGIMASTVLIAFPSVIQVVVGYRNSPITDSIPGTVSVSLSTGATWTSSEVTFTHSAPVTIAMVNPIQGQNGTVVNITGMLLFPLEDSLMSVTLAGVTARIIRSNNSFIQVIAARPATLESFSGPVVIQAASGALNRYTSNFTYLQEGIIFAVTPTQGQNGTRVKIEGQELFGGGERLSTVLIAGIAADIDNTSDNSCVMVTALVNPSSNNDSIRGDILLISNTGAHVRRINGWEYRERGVITDITPASGQYGTRIMISGMRLLSGSTGVSQITIGGVVVNNVTETDTVITGQAGNPGNGSAFNGTVTIISSDSGILATDYMWGYNQGGVISNFTPTSGGNREIITITGTNLFGSGIRIENATVAGVYVESIITQNNTFVTIESGIVRVQGALEGPIVLIANTGARIVSTVNYNFSSPCNITQYIVINDTTGVIECLNCDTACDSCVGPTDNECLTCSPTAFLVQSIGSNTVQCTTECEFATVDRQCVGLCAANQYQNTSVTENTTFCLNCSEMCAPDTSCDGPAPTQCDQCRNVSYLMECFEICPPNTYENENRMCLQCHEQCNGCTGPTDTECIRCQNLSLTLNASRRCVSQCPPNHYDNAEDTCLPCHPECLLGCTGSDPMNCMQCRSVGMRRNNGMIECVNDCNTVNKIYYPDNSTGITLCERCSERCSPVDGCNGSTASDCITCRSGTYNFNNTCELDCSQVGRNNLYYNNNITRSCELCDVSCDGRGCTGSGPSDCISANTGSNAETGAFEAGVGTIVIVVIICVLLFLMALVCMFIFLIQRSRNKGKYAPYPQISTDGRSTEMSNRYQAFKPNQETNFSKPASSTSQLAATNKPPIDEPTADEMYTDMSGTDDTLKRPLTGPNIVDQPSEEYVDVPNTPKALEAANQDVGGEEYIDVPTPGANVISNPTFDEGDALYEETEQAIEAAKAYVKFQRKEPPVPALPPSRSKPSIPTPSNPLQDSLQRASLQQQPQQEGIYEEGPIEEQLYEAIGGGAPEPPPPLKPKVPAASKSESNILPLPPK